MQGKTKTTSKTKKHMLYSVVNVFKHNEPACDTPMDLGLIRDVYADAIAVGPKESEDAGVALSLYLMMLLVFVPMLGPVVVGVTKSMWSRGSHVFPITFCLILGIFVLGMGLFVAFLELYRPLSNAILFDRKRRRVCIRTLDISQGVFWGRRAGQTECYGWDQVQVEHRTQLNVTGASAFRVHYLVLRLPNPDYPEQSLFPMGLLNQVTAPAFYEFLRQYMEEDGPPLTHGHRVESSGVPKSWRDSVRMATPFGPNYGEWCKSPMYAIGLHALFPLAIVYYLIRIVCHQLAFRTAIKVDWSPQVQADIGEPLRTDEIKALMASNK